MTPASLPSAMSTAEKEPEQVVEGDSEPATGGTSVAEHEGGAAPEVPDEAVPDEAGPEGEVLDEAGSDEAGPDEAVPPVAAIMVTSDPGPWLEEALAALAAQDYPNLVVVVVDAASEEDPTARVAEVAPSAFIRRLEENHGFGASANVAMETVEGVSHFVFCHDDAAPDPSAVRLLVEEAFRSNAAIVAPKMVAWDDPSRILSVGMNADKLGALADRAIPGEIDQEQHDSVRDVFVAPGGFTLVRADLFSALGGFDPRIRMFGEDLDLCWRAQVAGARVVVAPQARVRHIEVTRSGTQWRGGVSSQDDIRAMVRRHELRTLVKCYSSASLIRVLPQAVLASLAEIVVCLVGGKFARARAVTGAWRWNLGSRASRQELRVARRVVQAQRHLPDREVRQFQAPGFARVSSFARRLVASYVGVHHLSIHGVEADENAPVEDLFGEEASISDGDAPSGAGTPPGAETVGTAAGPPAGSAAARPFLSLAGVWDVEAPSWVLAVWVLVLLLLVFSLRHWVTAGLPILGQIAHLPSSVSLVHRYIDGRASAGVGAYTPAPVADVLSGAVSTVLAGSSGFFQKVLFLGAFPVGALGAYRMVVPWGSRGERVLAMVAYLAVPLPYDLFSTGQLEGMVAYAATPWLAARLFRASRMAPFAGRAPGRGWRWWTSRRLLSFGLILAVVEAFVPGEVLVLGVVLAGMALGSLLVGRLTLCARALALGVSGALVAGVLLFPWLPSFRGDWHGLGPLAGLGGAPWTATGLGSYIRFDVGFLGGGVAGWALLMPAALAVVIGRGWRFRWAVRLWGVMVVSWLSAWAGAHGWLGEPVQPGLFLEAGAVALSLAVALGFCAFDKDLPSHRFGWRQAASAVAGAGLVVAVLPILASYAGGQSGLPESGWGQIFGGRPQGIAEGETLWIGDPRALPTGSWPLSSGVAYAVTAAVIPDGSDLWPPVDPHRARQAADDILAARGMLTTSLGADLAHLGIRSVVVPLQLAPGQTEALPPSPWVLPALEQQGGLRQVRVDPSVAYFRVVTVPGPPATVPAPVPPLYRYGELAGQLLLWILVVRQVARGTVSSLWSRRRQGTDEARAPEPGVREPVGAVP